MNLANCLYFLKSLEAPYFIINNGWKKRKREARKSNNKIPSDQDLTVNTLVND